MATKEFNDLLLALTDVMIDSPEDTYKLLRALREYRETHPNQIQHLGRRLFSALEEMAEMNMERHDEEALKVFEAEREKRFPR